MQTCFVSICIFYYHAWLEADTHSASPQTHVWSPLCNKRNEALTKMPVLKLCFCLSKRIANLSKTAVYITKCFASYVNSMFGSSCIEVHGDSNHGKEWVLFSFFSFLDSIFQLIRLISFLNKKREIPFFLLI